ncbi:hemolysin family protein [Rhodococcus chondri]|uniref:Hemolysin family protein n=1 Tax=Rhodococcus chondri TaxID=3065941 RepID=A0ABU7JYA2_9NOCA|nr:hemolysin family protein [Rhodococcus sp. CC-R104]MEE2034777.1 hemolysin family protein [Rhodococcus sp. CC-R104]
MTWAIVVNLTLVLVFVLLGGAFAAAEIALVSLNTGRVRALERRGRRGARVAKLVREPNRFLAAVQIGVTVAGFFSAAYGASAIAPRVAPALHDGGLPAGAASAVALVVTTLVISYLSLVLGELVPKRIALQRASGVALLTAPVLDRFASLVRPVIWLLSASTDAVVRLLGGDPTMTGEEVTHDDVRDMVLHTAIPERERTLLSEVFDAGERSLSEVMTPRTAVQFLDATMCVADAREVALHAGHIRYPVCAKSVDDIAGVVHLRDLMLAQESGTVGQVCRRALHLPSTIPALAALPDLRRDAQQFAVVVDEYGGTAGIVTLEDIVEEIIGEVGEQSVSVAGDLARGGEQWVDGLVHLGDFHDETGLALPDGDYETVAGFVQDRLQRIPEVGDSIVFGEHRLIVDSLDGRRISRVRLVLLDEEDPHTFPG